MGEMFAALAVCIIFGFLGGRIAEGYGREKTTGVILGALFGIWALIGYVIIGPKNK